MKEPIRKRKRAHTRKLKPPGQSDLDLELQLQEIVHKSASGEGDLSIDINNRSIEDEEPLHPPQTPPSPPEAGKSLYPDGPRACLYEYPATREWIRNKLQELGVTNQHQLIRTYTAAELLEAISDYERALDDGFRVRYPTAYFRSLLK